jgi:hypothetical protein
MSFYGVAHDRLIRVVEDRGNAVRVTVSTRCTRVGADRQIGVWCIRRSPAGRWNRKLKRTRNPRAVSVLTLFAGTRSRRALARFEESQSAIDSRRRVKKASTIRDKETALP